MPLRPDELDFMQKYLAGAPREDLQGQLAKMYGPVTSAQQAAALGGADQRIAQNMSMEPAMSVDPGLQTAPPPVPPPTATDAGGPAMSLPPANVSEAPAMSTVSPEQLKTMGAEAQARLSAAEQPTEEAATTEAGVEQSPEQRGMQRYLLGAGRPGGAYQQGGEQLAERTIKQDIRSPMSPETAQALEDASIDAQGLAVGQGESAAGMLEKQAAQQGAQAQQARADLAQYKRVNAAKQAEYDMRQGELDTLRAQYQREPLTFWSGKDTGTQIMNGIGLFLLGLGGGPEVVQRVIDRDIATKEKARGMEVSLVQDRLKNFRDNMPSPESAQLYTRSLALDAAAAQTQQLADTAKAEDARQRGFALAEQLRQEALKARAAAETAAQGSEEIKTKNMPGKWTGGGKSAEEQIIERGKKAGLSAEQALAYAIHGQTPSGGGEPQTEHEFKLRAHERALSVRLPSGQEAFASTEKQKESLQRDLQAADATQKIYEDLAKITEQHALTNQWDREALGRVKADSTALLLKLRESEKEGGGLRLSSEMASMLGPLTGGGATDYLVGDQFRGSLKRAQELSRESEQQARELLSKSAYRGDYLTTPAGGKGSTFKPHAAPKGEH